jgi:hypothetical protein
MRTTVFVAALSAAGVSPLPGQTLFHDDFERGLGGWELSVPRAVRVLDSGDPARGRVLELSSDGADVWALIRGSADWGSAGSGVRIDADFMFPQELDSYLAVLYNVTRRGNRTDFGNIYIKNGSYIRVNPHRDHNVGRTLYEELRTPLTGAAAVEVGSWQHLRAEVMGRTIHFYVGDMETPQVTFGMFEYDSGALGFQPRSIGAPVLLDNVHAERIDRFAYDGPPRPDIVYQPDSLVTEWEVAGPYPEHMEAIERDMRDPPGGWRPAPVDARGAVITAAVTDYRGPRTVGYFRAHVTVPRDTVLALHLSSVDDVAIYINGRFTGGFIPRQPLAWWDFWKNPDHAGYPVHLELEAGTNRVLIRTRGGVYASGGFFARLEAYSQ